MSYLAIAKAVEARLRAEREQRDPSPSEVIDTAPILQPDPNLTQAYSRYWSLPESEPLEVFQAVHHEIVRLETQADPAVAWRTLRQTATAFHAESGTCPFCRTRGPLHLPAADLEDELRPIVIPPVTEAK